MPIIEKPKEAIKQSYTRPVMYKNNILFRGKVIVRYA
jgi:hypothetical protein